MQAESRREAELMSSTRVQADDTANVLEAMHTWWGADDDERTIASCMNIEDDAVVMKKPSGI